MNQTVPTYTPQTVPTEWIRTRVYFPQCHGEIADQEILLYDVWAEIKQPVEVYPSGNCKVAGTQEGLLTIGRLLFEYPPGDDNWREPLDHLLLTAPDESSVVLKEVLPIGYGDSSFHPKTGEYQIHDVKMLFKTIGDESIF